MNSLNKDYKFCLHIGKSSCGWHFGLCAYPEYNINNLEDWKKEFYDPINVIETEYGMEITPEKMLSIITERSAPDFDEQHQDKYEQDQLNKYNEWRIREGKKPYTSYDQVLNENTAERGLHGLWAHKQGDASFLHFKRTDGPYDITTMWDFC